MWKETLALAWHLADAALDVFEAPKKARIALALVGVAWSAGWYAKKFSRSNYTEMDYTFANTYRRRV